MPQVVPAQGTMITKQSAGTNQLETPTETYNPETGSGAQVPTFNVGSLEQRQAKAIQELAVSPNVTDEEMFGKLIATGMDPVKAATTVKSLRPSTSEHSPIYKEYQDYVATLPKGTVPKTFDQYMTDDANRKKAVVNVGGMNAFASMNDPQAIAEAVRAGLRPPILNNLPRAVAGAVESILAKKGPNGELPFNTADAVRTWNATLRLNATLQGPQQVRYEESLNSGFKMFDEVDKLADQWNSKGWGALSRANLKAASEGLEGPEKAKLANQLIGQIAQLTTDIAVLEQGGMTPTDAARAVAGQSLQAWWGTGTIHAMTEQGRRNFQIRRQARQEMTPLVIGNTGAGGGMGNAMTPQATPPIGTLPTQQFTLPPGASIRRTK